MVCEILSVGTELLLGDTVNTNAAFLAKELAGLGIAVYRQSTVGDNALRLRESIDYALQNSDMVIITGGLGPTSDDITKKVAAGGLELIIHEESLRRINQRFQGLELPENVHLNALIPEGSSVFPNDFGSAPGCVIERSGKILILLPGPPHEMEPMFLNYATSFLRKKSGRVFVSKTLKIIGLGETRVEEKLRDLIDSQENPTIAPYAKVGEVHVRLTASAENEQQARDIIAPLAEEINTRLAPNIYGEDGQLLAEIILAKLREEYHTLAIAESCTGGLVSSAIVAVSGCSDIYKGGVVAYSNDEKIVRLNVKPEIIKKHGAVSSETAAAMAEGAAKTLGTTVGISTTGIAGPNGDTDEKPVGLVYVGIYIYGRQVKTFKFNLSGNRNQVRVRAANLALDMLRREF